MGFNPNHVASGLSKIDPLKPCNIWKKTVMEACPCENGKSKFQKSFVSFNSVLHVASSNTQKLVYRSNYIALLIHYVV